jgi:uncharacterized protein (TIGR02391 family)
MAKNRNYPEPTPPSISREDGKRRLEIMREKGKAMLEKRPLSESAVETWANTTLDYIKQTFGSRTHHISTFIGHIYSNDPFKEEGIDRGYDDYAEREDARRLQHRIQVLNDLIELIDMEAGFPSTSQKQASQDFDFWSHLHPEVQEHSKSRFDSGHFADAVEAVLKHINSKIKNLVLRKTTNELDGASLMRTAFSPNNPVILLEDLSTESGRNIQQGYMDIFAGTMTGIRNPKAHANIQIDSKRAMHFFFLASLLLYVIDERQ